MRVLLVCPRFAPSNAADSHRARLLLPYFREQGIDVEVLAVDPRDVDGPVDPWLEAQLPEHVPVHRVRGWRLRGWGLGGLAQRAALPLLNYGSRLFSERAFDLVLFSTTEFLVHILGPVWQARHGVPFCMDYQDPWVNDYYRLHPEVEPPGGRLKHWLVDMLHRAAERRVVPRASGLLAVSEAYPQALDARYGDRMPAVPRIVLPFPSEPAEFRNQSPSTPIERGADSFIWRYVGRAGPDMKRAIRTFFDGWRTAQSLGASPAHGMRLETFGTTYANPSHSGFAFSVAPLADEYGLSHQVTEEPGRIGYRQMLDKLLTADGLVLFGSDDPAYTASKLYPYLLSRKPLLVICHERSSIATVMEAAGGGKCVTFSSDESAQSAARVAAVLASVPEIAPLNMHAFEPYTARIQARQISAWLGAVVQRSRAA